MTWEECAAAGMTVKQAAEACGKTAAAATKYAAAHGFRFSNSLPEGAPRGGSSAETLRARWADPMTRPAMVEGQRKGWDGRRYRVLLTDEQRRAYDKIRNQGIDRADALRAVGRPDLVDVMLQTSRSRYNGPRISPETIAGVRTLHKTGATQREIAEACGLCTKTVSRVINDQDFDRLVAPHVEQAVRQAAASGWTATEASRRLGLNYDTIRRGARLLGINLPTPWLDRKPTVRPEDIDLTLTWAENAARLGVTAHVVKYAAHKAGLVRRRTTVLSLLSDEERKEYARLRKKMTKAGVAWARGDILKAIGRGDLVEALL